MADEERSGVRRWVARIGGVVAMLPVLYVLGVGPVAWSLARQGYPQAQNDAMEAFYSPLITLHDNYAPIGDALDWYIDLWLP